jgi:hypothetical protein
MLTCFASKLITELARSGTARSRLFSPASPVTVHSGNRAMSTPRPHFCRDSRLHVIDDCDPILKSVRYPVRLTENGCITVPIKRLCEVPATLILGRVPPPMPERLQALSGMIFVP